MVLNIWKDVQLHLRAMQIKTIKKSFLLCQIGKTVKLDNILCWCGCEETGPFIHGWQESKMVPPLWRRIWQYLTKLHVLYPLTTEIQLLGIYPEGAPPTVWKYICTKLFTAAFFVIVKYWKLPISPSIGDGLNKIWYIHAVEYCAAVWRKPKKQSKGVFSELVSNDFQEILAEKMESTEEDI